MAEKLREYTLEAQDTLNTREAVAAAIASGALPEDFETKATIAESKITAFCKGCDSFRREGVPCEAVGSNDQARYAARKWCGWATVNGQRTVKNG